MKSSHLLVLALLTFTGSSVFAPLSLSGQRARDHVADEKEDEEEEEIIELSPFTVTADPGSGYYLATRALAGTRINTQLADVAAAVSTFGATPGGAQDLNFARLMAETGRVPHPDTLTAEGLFSEHDLPILLDEDCAGLFCVQAAAIEADFPSLPEVRYLAQLGFSSGLDPATWQRAPLNLVAVVDKSGSMNGEPLGLVRASLKQVLSQLRPDDQLSIILYGDRSHVHLPPTRITEQTRPMISDAVDDIISSGSTFMEAGLRMGYATARDSAASFAGTTRLMLFTDERPNVGATEPGSFMQLAEAGARDGIGLTTIGVGVHFGAELATRISGTRGGNLFFFPDAQRMVETFEQKFDLMVTELAHDFSIRLEPERGFRIAGIFGIPNEAVRWDGNALLLEIATIFLSRERGAIYFALAPDQADAYLPPREPQEGDALAEVAFRYREVVAGDEHAELARVPLRSEDTPGLLGLRRGHSLVDEFLSLQEATRAHYLENDQASAFKLLAGLRQRLAMNPDPALSRERDLVTELHNTLAVLSGNHGEVILPGDSEGAPSLLGFWSVEDDNPDILHDAISIWPNGVLERLTIDREGTDGRLSLSLATPLPSGPDGVLVPLGENSAGVDLVRYRIAGDTLTLEWQHASGEIVEETLARCTYSDLQASDPDAETVDPVSGLPRSRSRAAVHTTSSLRRR